jgi:hypothetical protein
MTDRESTREAPWGKVACLEGQGFARSDFSIVLRAWTAMGNILYTRDREHGDGGDGIDGDSRLRKH